jgi:ubiquinone/menaquinone biosynthesis C-methylase UbiE
MQWNTRERAAEYDELAARTVPDREHFYTAVTDALPERTGRVLELGCGTGLLTARIRKKRPETAVTCIDRSATMLAVARQKPELRGVTWIRGDIRDPWPAGPYDAVASTFCLFALEAGEQRAVLRQAYRVLRPGGVCITGCVVRPEAAEEEKHQLARFEAFMRDAGLDPGEIRRQLEAWDGARERIPTLDGFIGLLEAAGFSRIRCPYHRGLYAVVVAVR